MFDCHINLVFSTKKESPTAVITALTSTQSNVKYRGKKICTTSEKIIRRTVNKAKSLLRKKIKLVINNADEKE